MRNNLRSVFESYSSFDDIYEKIKVLQSEPALDKFIFSLLLKPQSKAGFVWQYAGNQASKTIKDLISDSDYDFVEISKFDSVDSIISKSNHIYNTSDDADKDETTGFLFVNDISRANQNLIDLIVSLITSSSSYRLAPDWRVICTGNVESGQRFWKDVYNKIFLNVEWAPRKKSSDYDEDSELDDSVKPKVKNSLKESYDDGFDKFYDLIKRAESEGEFETAKYITFYHDGFRTYTESEYDKMNYFERKKCYDVSELLDQETGIISRGKLAIALHNENILK